MRHIREMAFAAAVVAITSISGALPAAAQDVDDLAYDCEDGDMRACNQLMRIARSQCLRGDRQACRIADQIGQHMSSMQQNENYGGGYEAYPGDPLAQHRGMIDDTNSYIRSYCSDPKIASQLRGFGYCK
jgi:hypothetical protein